jgi:alpha-L-rhamnosidase
MRLFSTYFIMISFASILCFLHGPTLAQGIAKPVALRCEYLENPLGIDVAKPRLSWRLEDSRPGANQTAFEIMVDKDSMALQKGNALLWKLAKKAGDGT